MTDTVAVADQPSLRVAQSPSFCRLCDVELRGVQTWRAHVKSDAHVRKLQLKVAEPGSGTSPPTSPLAADANPTKITTPPRLQSNDEQDAGDDIDGNSDDGGEDGSEPDGESLQADLALGNCLFCSQESLGFDDNMEHMAATHGFNVPFQDFLAVDLETVVLYLQFVIYRYQECICCGTQRSTLEGVQQHMVAKGHCRFDISSDTEEFYEMPQSENALAEQMQRDATMPVRLPSGKLVSNRKNPESQEPRPPRRTQPEPDLHSFALDPETSSAPSLEVAHRRGTHGSREVVQRNEAILAAQLSRLRIAGDRIQQKQEARKRGRLEAAQNIILMQRFRLDAGDGRISRKFRS